MIFLLGVIKIKTKLLIIVMAVVLFVNSYDLRVFANTDYDHNELMEYNGYAETMYESIVEQTTFISGRYTENKEYVNESINAITDYAKGWWNEYESISNMPPKEKIREMLNAAGGYALTVGDFIKNLFTDASNDDSINPLPETNPFDAIYIKANFNNRFTLASGYGIYWDYLNGNYMNGSNLSVLPRGCVSEKCQVDITVNGYVYVLKDVSRTIYNEVSTAGNNYVNTNNISALYKLTSYHSSLGFTIKKIADGTPVQFERLNKNFTTINNYLKNPSNNVQIQTPQPKAYLSCPDGTRINMSINGGTFLDVNGQVMQISKDGTATVSSQICNLGWEKPTVGYIPGTDQVGITTPDGKIIDAETGESITGEFDDEIEDGCGTLCAIGKLLKGLGTLASSIAAIPLKILDGLFELIKKIVVPPDNYFTEQMDTIKDEFFNEEIEEGIQSIEELSNVGGGTFESVQVSLMGVDNLMVVDSSSVNKSLDTIHSWIRGIFYPLLLFFNINMLYRLIRGTSLVGIGKIDFSPPKEGKK